MASVTRRFINWAAAFEDGAIMRAAFFGLLSATAVILWLDYREMSAQTASTSAPGDLTPILPAFDPAAPGEGGLPPSVTTPADVLRAPLSVTLESGGTLAVTGTILPGSAEGFAKTLGTYAEYVKVVSLNSPGGSVLDALAIGRLIREKGLTTSVADGALCASSCPLVFAGGKERLASPGAAIAVHQIYAATPNGTSVADRLAAAGSAMRDAQSLTAEISRYLADMGVEAEVWLRALETPPDRLSYFKPDELTRFKLATSIPT